MNAHKSMFLCCNLTNAAKSSLIILAKFLSELIRKLLIRKLSGVNWNLKSLKGCLKIQIKKSLEGNKIKNEI